MSSQVRHVGILLAAGPSARFSAIKLLQPMPDSTPLVVAAARNLRAVLAEVVAVVPRGDEQMSESLARAGCQVVAVAGIRLGIGSSIAAGTAALPEADGWVLALADMPAISSSTVQAVTQRLADGASAVVPCYRGRRGYPVGFGRPQRGELLALRGEIGAGSILSRFADQVVALEVNDPGVLLGVDAAADLAALGGPPGDRSRGSP